MPPELCEIRLNKLAVVEFTSVLLEGLAFKLAALTSGMRNDDELLSAVVLAVFCSNGFSAFTSVGVSLPEGEGMAFCCCFCCMKFCIICKSLAVCKLLSNCDIGFAGFVINWLVLEGEAPLVFVASLFCE